jgi:hypothetical protein
VFWKVVHWEPDDDGKWQIVCEVTLKAAYTSSLRPHTLVA